MVFDDLVFKPHIPGHTQAVVHFANEYGASVISGPKFYCTPDAPFELAVLYKNQLCYSTALTNAVLGYLTKEQVTEYLGQIEALD
jgi:hypothetical protein